MGEIGKKNGEREREWSPNQSLPCSYLKFRRAPKSSVVDEAENWKRFSPSTIFVFSEWFLFVVKNLRRGGRMENTEEIWILLMRLQPKESNKNLSSFASNDTEKRDFFIPSHQPTPRTRRGTSIKISVTKASRTGGEWGRWSGMMEEKLPANPKI